jgi:hypothetical protein
MATVQEAAQELIEAEALCMNLRSCRSECIGKIKSIKTADDTSYFLANSEAKHLRIFEAQWCVYNYINTIHALWEFMKESSKFIDGSKYRPQKKTPKLLAIRNCMQHNGPLGVNYVKNKNELAIPVQRLQSRGNWGGKHRPFGDYFPNWSRGDMVFLRSTVEKSDSVYKSLYGELERKHSNDHSSKQLERAAASLSLYK